MTVAMDSGERAIAVVSWLVVAIVGMVVSENGCGSVVKKKKVGVVIALMNVVIRLWKYLN